MLLTSNECHYKQYSRVHIFLKAVTAVVPIISIFLGQFRLYSASEVSPPCSQETGNFIRTLAGKFTLYTYGSKRISILNSLISSTMYVIFGIKDRYIMMFSKNEFYGNQYSETQN